MKEDPDEFNLPHRMKDFEDKPLGGDKIKTETTPQVKQDAPINDIEGSKQKLTEWLKTVRPKGERMTVLSIYLAMKELWISHNLFFRSQQ